MFTKEKFGNNALYIISIISGLTDVDAITLSLSQLIKGDALKPSFGWTLLMVFKGVMAMVIGAQQITQKIVSTFVIIITEDYELCGFGQNPDISKYIICSKKILYRL